MRTARRGLSALGIVSIAAVSAFSTGCTIKSVENNEGSAGAGSEGIGSGGSTTGGTGGSTAGSGGSNAGSGGNNAGAGGSTTAGSGGSTTAGSGGTTAGSGGAVAGSGGSTAGSAGTSSGGSAGTSGGGSAGTSGGAAGTSVGGAGGGGAEPLPSKGVLSAASDCTDAETRLKNDLRARSNSRIDAQIAYYKRYDAKPKLEGNPPSAAEPNYQRTNNQVAGVDEADIVKSDDQKHIYFLHDQLFTVFEAVPAASTKLVGSALIEGTGLEMYVEGNHAVVFSSLQGASGKAIYDAAKVTPKAAQAPTSSLDPVDPYRLVKITVLAITDNKPAVVSERYVEGVYATARRAKENVRAIINAPEHGPELSFYGDDEAELEQFRKTNNAKIDASKVTDYLPYRFEKKAGVITAVDAACDDFFVPPEGTTGTGSVLVESFDWNTPEQQNPVYLRADARSVYANENQVVLASTAWGSDDIYSLFDYTQPPPDGTVAHVEETHVHRFDFAETKPVYVGSVTLPGRVPSQFALDIDGSSLRVVTSETAFTWQDGYPAPLRTNHLYTLTAGGTALSSVGSLHDYGLDESIRSARFVGDRGYVVTFQETDPLFVFDLGNPAKPAILGELKIQGFSEYIHPIDAGHLLTIGREATLEGDVLGLAVQIFDVTDPTAPKLSSKSVFEGDESAYSDAEVDHKAFAYDAEHKTLVFPVVHTDGTDIRSTLQVYDIDVTTGVKRRGSVNHDAYFSHPRWAACAPFLGETIKRGFYLGGNLYAVSNAAITAHSTSLATVATIGLQEPSVLGFTCAE